MSLQVWLPLNGDLHNQGLANVTVTGFNTPTFIAGKLGKCCHLSQSSSQYLEIVGDILNTILVGGSQPFSVCFWIKNEETLNTTNRAIICGDYSSSGWNIEIRNTANGRIRFYWSAEKVSDSDTYSYSVLQNEWMHIAVIYTGSQIIIYKNGINPKITTTTLAERTKTNSEIRIGRDYRSSPGQTYFTGCLNDFRIYDHALSAKEVEEIAKGLVLHYKLDDAYIEGTHNYMSASQSIPNLETQVINDVSTSGKYWNQIPIDGLGTYTFSVYIKNTTNKGIKVVLRAQTSSKSDVGDYIQGNLIDSGKEGWSIVTVDLTTITNAGGVSIKTGVWLSSGAMNTLTSNPTMGYMQLEKKDHRTPWTLGGTTRAASVIAYDSSGYQNNGIIVGRNKPTHDIDSPRYSLSTNFNAYNTYIMVNNFSNTLKNITNGSISWWQKGSQAQSLLATGNLSTGGTYFIMATNSSRDFYHQNSGTITVYKNGISGAYRITVGEWDFYCITGVDLSAWSTFRLNDYSSTYHIGSISDFRIYATVLTESQIQELYNTSALIDKNGNIYPRELVEE